jgi:hypothetical protein
MNDDSLKVIRTLAADSRNLEVDPSNDQVWELNISGDPPALALRTSYGLRSVGIRVFPKFTLQGVSLSDPLTFTEAPRLDQRHTNSLSLECTPFPQLNVQLEYWVPSSQVLCSRFKVTNVTDLPIICAVDWVVTLKPIEPGEPMSPALMGINTVLQGKSDGVYPVFFLTGGPEAIPGAQPSLQVKMTLEPGASRKLSWSLATLDSPEASFSLARHATSLPWDVENARTAMHEKSTSLEFWPENDLLHETQIKAHQLLIHSPAPVKRLTFLTKRQPDRRNFTPINRKEEWISYSQITAYDAWMLSRVLLPADPHPFKEIIQSFIDFQQEDGSIPWAVSQSGVASTALTPPLLAGIVCDVHPLLGDISWLTQVYPPLLRACKSWFTRFQNDPPVWDTPVQTALPDLPPSALLNGSCSQEPLRYIHNPALDTLLIKECRALLQIAGWLEQKEGEEWLAETAASLTKALSSCWDEKRSSFTYRDIDSNLACASESIHEFGRNGSFKLKRNFKAPRRLSISPVNFQEGSHTIRVTCIGWNGEKECTAEMELRRRYSTENGTQIVSSHLFTRLDSVQVDGLPPKSIIALGLSGNDWEDISLLLPLGAGILTDEQVTAAVEKNLLPRYLANVGLAAFPTDRVPDNENVISPFWNYLIVEALLSAGRRDAAGRIMQILFNSQTDQWRASGYTNSLLRIDNPFGSGELDSLAGLPAIWPLMRVLGIEKFSDKEIILNGFNEFLPSCTVKYRGNTLTLNTDLTSIQTINGEQIGIKEKAPIKVVLP